MTGSGHRCAVSAERLLTVRIQKSITDNSLTSDASQMPDLTFAEAAAWFEQSAQDFERDVTEAERRTAEDFLIIAEDQSSGTYSQNDLARMGRPYARRHRGALLDPAKVNVLSGDFRGAWDTEGPTPDGDGLTTVLFNTDSKAEKWLQPGTKFMVARPVDAAIEERAAPRREARIEHALDKLTS